MIKLLLDTLKFLDDYNVPVKQGSYSGDTYPYVTFFEVGCNTDEYSDDREELEEHRIQIDLWSKTDTTSLKLLIRKSLKKNFYGVTSRDILDGDIKHVIFECYYYNEED